MLLGLLLLTPVEMVAKELTVIESAETYPDMRDADMSNASLIFNGYLHKGVIAKSIITGVHSDLVVLWQWVR